MTPLRTTALVALIVAAALVLAACPQAAAPPATATPTAAPPTPTRPPATPTPLPATPTPLPPTPTRAPAVATPVASPTAAGVAASDLAAKARANAAYSFEGRITAAAQTINIKGNVKGTKQRQEISAAGMNTVMIMDSATKTAYMYLPDQKTATKLDFGQVAAQSAPTAEQVAGLPSDARFVGTETVDGKSAAVYEVPSVNAKFWLWTERGVPLKAEIGSGAARNVAEFTNYQFGPQPDSLFELPPGTQVSDTALPIPGKMPPLPTP